MQDYWTETDVCVVMRGFKTYSSGSSAVHLAVTLSAEMPISVQDYWTETEVCVVMRGLKIPCIYTFRQEKVHQ